MPRCEPPPEGGVGGGEPTGGYGWPGTDTDLYPQTDQEVIDAVRTAYFLDPVLPEHGFEVESINRVVYLRGVVATLDLKKLAESVAAGVQGVNRVVNELHVAQP